MVEFVTFLFIALALVTVIGHGIWAAVAWLGRRLLGKSTRSRRSLVTCIFCGRPTPPDQRRCQWCGRDLTGETANELRDLDALIRQVRRFRDRGTISSAQAGALLARARTSRDELNRSALAPHPAVDPASPPAPAPRSRPLVATESPVAAQLPVPTPDATGPPSGTAAESRPVTPQPPPLASRQAAPAESSAASRPRPAAPAKRAEERRPAPAIPKRSWTEMVAGFMQERNIRWGEVVGGLLIVGSSVALVLSLWDQLKEIRYFPFFIFVAVTAALFGVGLYARHRWHLAATSFGLLVIATLLVPLDFLAMAALSKGGWDTVTISSALIALALFAWLIGHAARALVAPTRLALVLAVVGSSGAVLLISWWTAAHASTVAFLIAAFVPVVCFAVAIGAYFGAVPHWRRLDPADAASLFTLLGTGTFAMAVALGLLVSQAADLPMALNRLAVLVALVGISILVSGMAVVGGSRRISSAAAYHVGGTTTALLGMLTMLAALGLAWPHPLGVITVGVLDGAALALAAFVFRLPILHAGTIACAAAVYLTTFHVAYGPSQLPLVAGMEDLGPRMLRLTVAASSGTALAGLFVILGVVAELLARIGRHRHSRMYAGGCGVVALAGLILVSAHAILTGGPDAMRAACLYGLYGTGSLLLAARWRRAEWNLVGLGLLAAAPLWLLWWHIPRIQPVWAAVLAVESLGMTVLAAAFTRLVRRGEGVPEPSVGRALGEPSGRRAVRTTGLVDCYRVPLLQAAETVALLALAIGLVTAWRDRATLAACPWPVMTMGATATVYLLLAWLAGTSQRTWTGSTILLVGLVHALVFNYRGLVDQPWVIALLAHCTLAVGAGTLLHGWAVWRGNSAFTARVARLYDLPLTTAALLSAVLAAIAVPFSTWASTVALAWCLVWLAATWLVVAWRSRSPMVFAVHQGLLALAVLAGTTAWLEHQSWVFQLPRDLIDPRSLLAYGIALAGLAIAWTSLRIISARHVVAARLLRPGWPTVDWLIYHTVVWLQLALAVWCLLPGIGQELLPRSAAPSAGQIAAAGTHGWLLVGLLGLCLTLALWESWGRTELVSCLLLAATVPVLIAGRFVGDQAAASGLRWGLAACFLICSMAVWGRVALVRLSRRVGARVALDGSDAPRLARAVLLATTAMPVLFITILAAMLQMVGSTPPGPAAGSGFEHLGATASYLMPLLWVVLALVGHSVRERSAGYAFTAGLVVELGVVLGYALHVATDPGLRFGTAELVTVIQLATLSAAVWAGLWLVVRHWLDVWREGAGGGFGRPLMSVQLGMAGAGNMLLIVVALAGLALLHPHGQAWTVAAGKPLGWVTLLAALAVYFYRQVEVRRQLSPQLVGLVGMMGLGLLACTVQWQWPAWGYRALMIAWATYAWSIVSATWWVASVRTLPGAQGPPQAMIRLAAAWVRAAGLAAVLLGLKAAVMREAAEDLLWAAAAIAIASAAGATMAVWRRRDGWAFAAGLGVNLAASLVVWYFHRAMGLRSWGLLLAQVNVTAWAAVALIWLAARKRLYELREWGLGDSFLLALQTALPVVGNAALLATPLWSLLETPAASPPGALQLAAAPGWLALVLTAVAAAWYVRQLAPGALVHVLAGLGLATGILTACDTGTLSDRTWWNPWLGYHTLTVIWTVVALLVLGLGIVGRRKRLATQRQPRQAADETRRRIFPGSVVRAWTATIGTLVIGLALLHAITDPGRPWWSAGALSVVSVTAGILAIWRQRSEYVYASGLLVNLVGMVVWLAWNHDRAPRDLLMTNALCLAIGSAAWSLVGRIHRGATHLQEHRWLLPFTRLAAEVAIGLLTYRVVVGVAAAVGGWHRLGEMVTTVPLDWTALLATTVALALCLWQAGSRLVLPGLWLLGLLGLAMGLGTRSFAPGPHEYCWTATLELAVFVLAAAVLGRWLPQLSPVWQAWRIPEENRRGPKNWLPAMQTVATLVGAGLSLWVSMDVVFDRFVYPLLGWPAGRTVGAVSTVVLLIAAVSTAGSCRGWWRAGWQQAALGLGLLLLSELGFAWLVPHRAPWLHRGVVGLAAALVMAALSGVGLPKLLPKRRDWISAGRRATPPFIALAVALLASTLAQEAWWFDPAGGVMAWPAVAVVAASLAGLAVLGIVLATRPDWDPWALSARGRTLYVYAAEVLVGLLGLHFWLTMSWLFHLGIVQHYWMLIVMAVAAVGAGLSEWFHRRGQPVLAEPLERTALLLPMAPAIGFWLTPSATGMAGGLVAGASPSLWLVMALFYGFQAVTKRSPWVGTLAALAANTGLWVLLHRQGWSFLDHPQLWLIPGALIVLVAEHVAGSRLRPAQRVALRYIALSVIYFSSTTEFMRGIGQSVVLPLVLVALSLVGVLSGILLRTRCFLYLGTTFLLVVIVRMIVYAAFEEGQMWVFWICCILLGIAILALFAVFEKRRNDVLSALERLHDWRR